MKNRKEEFIEFVEWCISAKCGLCVYVSNPAMPKDEEIINPIENLEYKLAYYKSAYNDELQLIANTMISISDWAKS